VTTILQADEHLGGVNWKLSGSVVSLYCQHIIRSVGGTFYFRGGNEQKISHVLQLFRTY
jgi:hypothetical protein